MYHYFSNKLSSGFVALYSGRMLQFAGNGVLGLFLPVYLYIQLNMQIELVFLWYLVGHLVYAIVLPWGARMLNSFGLRKAIQVSVIFDVLYLGSIFLIEKHWIFLILSILFITIARVLFWMPFHVDFAKFTDKNDRGKEVSIIWATKAVLGIIMPIISGFLVAYFNFLVIFIIGSILYLAAIIPFLTLPRTKERFSWGYVETFKKCILKKNRGLFWANMANGAESAATFVIWPIFIWELLSGNFIEMGLISSLLIFIGVILQLIAGRYADLFNKRKMLHWGSLFYSFGWFFKVFVLTGWQIFWVGAYHQLTQIFKDTPFDTLNYEILADKGHYVDEYTVVKEIAIQLGRVFIFILGIIVAMTFGLNWTFALAALATLFVNLL